LFPKQKNVDWFNLCPCPRALPQNFVCIASSNVNSEDCIRSLFNKDTWYSFELPKLSLDTSQEFITKYLERYNKVKF
jgi:hypothetical protein